MLEDPSGGRIVLRDRPGEDPCAARLAMLELPAGSALFGLMYYHEGDRSLCLHPFSLVTPAEVVRLQY